MIKKFFNKLFKKKSAKIKISKEKADDIFIIEWYELFLKFPTLDNETLMKMAEDVLEDKYEFID